MSEELLLKVGEVAAVLRVTRATVRKMLERGDLEGFRRGRLTRITRASVERLIETRDLNREAEGKVRTREQSSRPLNRERRGAGRRQPGAS